MKKYFFPALFLIFSSAAYSGDADIYLESLVETEKSPARDSLEVLYSQAQLAVEDLNSEHDFKNPEVLKEISAKYRGFSFSSSGTSLNYDFFLRLAESKGLKSDADFFKIAMRENSSWPDVYRKMFSGNDFCYTLGGGDFSALYRAWKMYSLKYPSSYTEVEDNSIETIESVVSGEMDNMCYTKEAVLKELALFREENHDSEINPEVKAFMVRIKGKKCRVKFDLLSNSAKKEAPPLSPETVGPKKD